MRKNIFFIIFSIIISINISAQTDPIIDFQSETPNHENIIIVFAKLIPNAGSFQATSTKGKGRLYRTLKGYESDRLSVHVDSFKTENSVRDGHVADFMSGGKNRPHPRIDLLNLRTKGLEANAQLVVNNIKKDISFNFTETKDYVEAEFEINTKDFNLPEASFLGVKVENTVKIKTKFFWTTK